MEKQHVVSYLLGRAHASLARIQDHLIQNDPQKALSMANETMRYLNDEISKSFYKEENKDDCGKV